METSGTSHPAARARELEREGEPSEREIRLNAGLSNVQGAVADLLSPGSGAHVARIAVTQRRALREVRGVLEATHRAIAVVMQGCARERETSWFKRWVLGQDPWGPLARWGRELPMHSVLSAGVAVMKALGQENAVGLDTVRLGEGYWEGMSIEAWLSWSGWSWNANPDQRADWDPELER